MSIYLVSNRKVTNNRFSNKGKERASRDFRVAVVKNYDNPDKKLDYTILEDNDFDSYQNVVDLHNNQKSDIDSLPGTAYMFYNLYQEMLEADNKQSDCLFFIHGFANKLDDNLDQIQKLYDKYIAPSDSGIDHLVFVAWPTIGHQVLTYWNDQDDAEETGRVLGRMFNKLRGFFIEFFELNENIRCSNRIHLAAHSQGNTVLEHMIRTLKDHQLFHLFGEVLLLHSDVSWEIFEPGAPFSKLSDISSRTHMYVSRSDEVLGIVSNYTKNLKRRLGFRGPKNRADLDNETFIVDISNAGRADSRKEQILDHWGYIERKKVIDDITQVLAGKDLDDIKGRKTRPDEPNYFFLK